MTNRPPFAPGLAISQELWNPNEEIRVLSTLSSVGVKGVVLSLRRRVSDVSPAFNKEILSSFDLSPIALEEIISEESEGRIFEGKERKNMLLSELSQAAVLAGEIGAPVLTFDAPELRNGAFAHTESDMVSAVDFFEALSAIGKEHSVRFSIATCPEDYGCDFGRSLTELSRVLGEVSDSAGLGLHLATSSLLLEEGMVKAAVAAHGATCFHVDIADPFMRPMGSERDAQHKDVAQALSRLREMGHGPRWLTASGKRPASMESGAIVAYLMKLIDRISTIYLAPIPGEV